MGKVVRITERVLDGQGVIVSETTKENVVSIRKMEDEPAYVKMYIEDLGRILGLQEGHRKILMLLAASVDYEGIVSLSIGRKVRIAATAECSVKSIDNATSEFVKAGILKRIGRGEYELDPNLFAKGKWRDIRERKAAFALTMSYTHKGRILKLKELPADEAASIAAELEAKEQPQLF